VLRAETVEQVLKDGGVAASKVDEVVLIGGSTRIPAVQVSQNGRLLSRCGHSSSAHGSGSDTHCDSITEHTTRIAAAQELIRAHFQREPCRSINADEVSLSKTAA
jgi:molecular chaperone DnaK (HSP70)